MLCSRGPRSIHAQSPPFYFNRAVSTLRAAVRAPRQSWWFADRQLPCGKAGIADVQVLPL